MKKPIKKNTAQKSFGFYSKEAVRREVNSTLSPILDNSDVQKMKTLIQHGGTTTYDHCMNVAAASVRLSKALHIRTDEQRLVYGAFLHDFYLYDWHKDKVPARHHGFSHPVVAEKNARELLGQPDEVADIIITHMWPLTITRIPKSREAWIVCLTDTYKAFTETLGWTVKGMKKRKA